MPDGAQPCKQSLRRRIAATLRAIPPADLAAQSTAIRAVLQSLPFWSRADLILSYSPLPDEVDLTAAQDHRTAYPAIHGNDLQAWLPETGSALKPGPLGFREPAEGATPVSAADLDLILVPGRLFRPDGMRLGRGKGFYDRYLARPEVRAVKVGVCFTVQLADFLPSDPWDVPMDWIVHEQGVIECGGISPARVPPL